ncbi:MAG: hypothetical protein GQ533_10530 [Methanosarcinaceae archaeon]|nr:hypothetical protein [Methanosarcinaceae archaeon]
MFEERKKWIRTRFGNIDETILGQIDKVEGLSWPDIIKEYDVRGNKFKYQMVRNIEGSAERIAEIYINGLDEMVGNINYEWLFNPEEIINNVRKGDWNFYGCYFEGKLIAVVSMEIIQGQRAMHWFWGCVDPIFRCMGVWHHFGEYLDEVTEKSGAQLGFLGAVTSHKYSQMMVEKAGYKPIGLFVGHDFLGGSNGRYYRQNLVYYSKLYGESVLHLQKWESMELTESARKLAKTINELWADVRKE